MKPALAALLLVAVVAGALWIRSRANAHQERKFGSTDDLVQWLANEAVKDAWEQNHIKLDYGVDSIKDVERILGGVHDQYVRNPKSVSVNGLGSAYGAYIGEVIRRSEPNAHWQRDDAMGENSYPIVWGPTAGHSYPMAWCAHRITNGDEDNVWFKYRALKEGLVQKALPPKAK